MELCLGLVSSHSRVFVSVWCIPQGQATSAVSQPGLVPCSVDGMNSALTIALPPLMLLDCSPSDAVPKKSSPTCELWQRGRCRSAPPLAAACRVQGDMYLNLIRPRSMRGRKELAMRVLSHSSTMHA